MLRIFLLGFLLTYHHTEAGVVCKEIVDGTSIEYAAEMLKSNTTADKNYVLSGLCGIVRLNVDNAFTDGRVLMCVKMLQALLKKYLTEFELIVKTCNTGAVLKDLKCHDGDKLEDCMETIPKNFRTEEKCKMCKDGSVSWYETCYKKVTCNDFVEKAKQWVQKGCDVCKGKRPTERSKNRSKPNYLKHKEKSGCVALVPYSLYLRALAVLPFFWEIICIVRKSI